MTVMTVCKLLLMAQAQEKSCVAATLLRIGPISDKSPIKKHRHIMDDVRKNSFLLSTK